MEFAEFAARASEMEAEPADLATVALVRNLFRDAGDDLPVVVRFVQGRVFPAWDSTTLDVGPRLLHEAIARAAGTNVTADDVEDELADVGEIGAVAEGYDFGGQRGLAAFAGGTDGLTVAEVDETLRELAAADGEGSEDRKLNTLFGLFNRCSPEEAKFLARLVLSEMRIGVGEGTVRDAVAEAFLADAADGDGAGADESADTDDGDADEATGADGTDEEADEREDPTILATDDELEAVERALQVSNDYGMVATVARADGESGLAGVHLEVGRPVQAMLAQAGTVTDAVDAWDEAAVETKFDGARVQVHYDEAAGEVSLFSRNMDDVTDPLPEVVEFVEANVDRSVIVDGEVVAVDDEGDPLPFQEILRRFRRKHDVSRMREEVRVEFCAFDCLHDDGEDLLDAPLTARHDRLTDVLGDSGAVSELLVSSDADEIAAFEERALEAGHEGIMLKNPDSTYSPGNRGKNWLKRKPDVETLDLVVTGAEWGEGRRAEFLGTFLLSARTDEGYETIGKVATGITDERLADLTDLLEPEIRAEDGQEVDLRPSVVFEVGYEEIQESPTYSSGYALRFPRFVSVRGDKDPEDADSLERVERLADAQ
ncbi:DNA ligase-1 [Halopelagius inordinatus]|uniref:DNA ligase n=1 Tax=Halopelagius inordinatus TaxID=553467 RepID=A0A1I2UNV6_9EURY|nr:ATP-dependent DNA ligase LigA [Halopelagius inordinatus]SFG77347.1 DNA ligase-1 [Halopelagius inordinatus]